MLDPTYLKRRAEEKSVIIVVQTGRLRAHDSGRGLGTSCYDEGRQQTSGGAEVR